MAAEAERTSIVERRLAARLGTADAALVSRSRDAWTRFAAAQASLDAYLQTGGGSMAAQLASSGMDAAQELRREALELLLGDWPPAATAAELLRADGELNRTFGALRARLAAPSWPPDFGDAGSQLREVQRAWLAHRDALAALATALHAGDARAATVGTDVRLALTSERSEELKQVEQAAREAAAQGQ